MAGGFDALFDAYAAAALRDDEVWTAAFALPTAFILPGRTVVCTTRAELMAHLTAARRALQALGITRLDWVALEARGVGPGQHAVTVTWEPQSAAGPLEPLERLYVVRGEGADGTVTAVVADATFSA